MRSLVLLPACLLALSLTGCTLMPMESSLPQTGAAIQGKVFGGQQPLVGAHVYLMAAGTGGYGGNGIAASAANASISLLTSGVAGTDTIGGYVLTSSGGSFSISNDYMCAPGAQVYLYVLGGTSATLSNPAAGLLAVLGNCPASATLSATTPIVIINEASTIAAAYSFAGFATDATHVASSGTTQALLGMKNAFASAPNIVPTQLGSALSTTVVGNATAPQAEINTLANILAACVNSNNTATTASTICTTLFANTTSTTGVIATDTATAAINIAHNPGANIAALYPLPVGTGSPFQPALTAQPNDFTLALVFLSNAGSEIAIDGTGNVWYSNGGNSLIEYSSIGVLLSPATGFTGGGLNNPGPIAFDPNGYLWVVNQGTYNGSTPVPANSLSRFTPAGAPVSATPITGGGLNNPNLIAIDGTGSVWVGSNSAGTISKFTNGGVSASGSPFINGGYADVTAMALDNAGNLWMSSGSANMYPNPNLSAITELTPAGAVVPTSTLNADPGLYGVGAIDVANTVWGFNYAQSSDSGTNSILKVALSGTSPVTSTYRPNNGLNYCIYYENGYAIDGAGNIWCVSDYADSLAEMTPAGVALSPDAGYVIPNVNGAYHMAIDISGNVWLSDEYRITANGTFYNIITETIGLAAPVVGPTSLAVKNHTLGTRP
jgi:hypothetical protein